MADKAIYSVDTVTSMSGTDKVYVNTGNNIKQITKDNLCGNDIKGINNQVETLKTEVNNNTNAISDIKDNITTNIYNLNDIVKGKWVTDKNGSIESSTSWAYLPLNVKGLRTITISALGGYADWNMHYFNDSNGTTIAYNNSQVTVSVPSDATILYVNIYSEYTDINSIKITTESIGEIVVDNMNNIDNINSSMSDYGLNNVFDGEFLQGGMDSGTIVVKDDYVITKNKIYCSSGDFIKSFGNSLESSYACFYKSDNTYIGGLNALDGCTAPSDSAYCYVEFKRSGITPSTSGHISVYVNNQIDIVKNDVDDLKNAVDGITYDCGRASFGGSAATITQGGATWYAYGVGVLFAKEYNSVPGVQLTVIVPAGTLAIANLTNVMTTGFEATIWSLAELNGGTLEYMISKE